MEKSPIFIHQILSPCQSPTKKDMVSCFPSVRRVSWPTSFFVPVSMHPLPPPIRCSVTDLVASSDFNFFSGRSVNFRLDRRKAFFLCVTKFSCCSSPGHYRLCHKCTSLLPISGHLHVPAFLRTPSFREAQCLPNPDLNRQSLIEMVSRRRDSLFDLGLPSSELHPAVIT